jgi:hypothetical protein
MRGVFTLIGFIGIVAWIVISIAAKTPLLNRMSLVTELSSKSFLLLPISIAVLSLGLFGNFILSIIVLVVMAILIKFVGI